MILQTEYVCDIHLFGYSFKEGKNTAMCFFLCKGERMVKTSKITIGGNDYAIKCSIATVEYFERLTGTKFADVLSDILKVNKVVNQDGENIEDHLDLLLDMQIKSIKLAYCMILEAKKDGMNQAFNLSLDDFLGTIETIDPDTFKEVLTVAQGVFPRKVHE